MSSTFESLPDSIQRALQGSDSNLDQELKAFQAWSRNHPDWANVVVPQTAPPPQQDFESTQALFEASHQGWRQLLPVDRTPLYALAAVVTVLLVAVGIGSQVLRRSPVPVAQPPIGFEGPDLSQREFADLSLDRLSQINPEGPSRPRHQLLLKAGAGQTLAQMEALLPGSEIQGDRLLVQEFRDRAAAEARLQQFQQQGYLAELRTRTAP